MLTDSESIPQIPPSPRQLSVRLYSFVDVEHLLPHSRTLASDNHDVPYDPVGPTHERIPIPQLHSIQLHSLLEISSRDLHIPPFERISEIPPLPQQLSVNLYHLPDVHQVHSDAEQRILEHLLEIPASPRQISVDLYPLDDVESGAVQHTNVIASDVHQDVAPHRRPVPAIHGISLYPVSDLSDPVPLAALPTEISIPLGPVDVDVQNPASVDHEGPEVQDTQRAPVHDSPIPSLALGLSIPGRSNEFHVNTYAGSAAPMPSVVDNTQSPVSYGILYEGQVALIVRDIVEACEKIPLHKHQSRLILTMSTQILNAFNGIASTEVPQGSQQFRVTDELIELLKAVMRISKEYSNYNAVKMFLMNTKVKRGLDQCESLLLDAQNLCAQIAAKIQSTATQLPGNFKEQNRQVMPHELGELQDLLLDIFGMKPADLRRQIAALGDSQKWQASIKLMEAGQEEMRRIRESSVDSAPSGSQDIQPIAHIMHSQAYIQFQRGVVNLHRDIGIPPTKKVLNGEIERTSDVPVTGGTHGDKWKGAWLGEVKVALKAMKNTNSSNSRAIERFDSYINNWSHLKHENVLGVWGIVYDLDQHIYMVTPWQDNGNVLEYARDHPDISRLELMFGASEGLSYLRSNNVIHGNMKCANILVSSKGQACICDYELATVVEEVTERSASLTLTEGGSTRWMAPELIEGQALSKEADVYSFAMTILELMTGQHPYAECEQDAQVIHNVVVLSQPPARPQGEELQGHDTTLSDELWSMMLKCWCTEAAKRPSMTEVSSILKQINQRPVSVAGPMGNPQ